MFTTWLTLAALFPRYPGIYRRAHLEFGWCSLSTVGEWLGEWFPREYNASALAMAVVSASADARKVLCYGE